jgi:hypothetical protein
LEVLVLRRGGCREPRTECANSLQCNDLSVAIKAIGLQLGVVQLGLQIFWYDISLGKVATSSGEDVTCVFQATLSSSSHEVVVTNAVMKRYGHNEVLLLMC